MKSKLSDDWIRFGLSHNRKPTPMLSNVIDLLTPNRSGGSYANVSDRNLSSGGSTLSPNRHEPPNTSNNANRNLISRFKRMRSNSRKCQSTLSKYVNQK